MLKHLILAFAARSSFCTLTLAYWIDSLVRVSRRVGRSHYGIIFQKTLRLICSFCTRLRSFLIHESYRKTSLWLSMHKRLLGICTPNNYSSTASFSTISSLLTLFSKFFSSFLRSTCSLSVSHKYLALEEVYLPFRAAIPNYPTLFSIRTPGHQSTGLSPSMMSSSKELT